MAKSEETSAARGGIGSLNELEHLREILYGDQSRATAERLDDLEAQLEKNRKEYKRLVDVLKQALTERINSLAAETGQQLNQEKEERNALAAEMNQQVKKLDQKQAKELSAMAASLEARKVSREELGAMLIEIGQRLQDGETT